MKSVKLFTLFVLIFCLLLGSVACTKNASGDTSDESNHQGSEFPLPSGNGGSTNNPGVNEETNGESTNNPGVNEETNGGSNSEGDNGGNGSADGDNTLKHAFSRYALTANKDNAYAMDAATALSIKLTDAGYSLKINTPSEYEIIIGASSSTEYTNAMAKLSAAKEDFIIEFVGKKIIIAAKKDIALTYACDTFFEKYVKTMNGTAINVANGTCFMGNAEGIIDIVSGGVSNYEIVFGHVSDSVRSKGNELATAIKTYARISSVTVGAPYSASKPQILIGAAGYSETSKALSAIAANEYTVTKINNKIIVSGKTDDSTILAIDEFIKVLDKALSFNKTQSAGNYTIALPDAIIDTFCASLNSVPRFTGGNLYGTYPSDAGVSMLYYNGVNSAKIDEYVTTIEALGFKKVEDNRVGANRFITCYGKSGLVHLSYLAPYVSLTVTLDSLVGATYKTNEPSYTKVTDTTLAVMSLDYDTTQKKSGSNYDASGMSYVITLEDGRYVVIDGGYGGAKDHVILYNYLKDNNKRADGKIVIAAWIFTHDHGDHYGCFVDFSNNYHSQVTLEYYFMNCGDKSRYDQTPSGWLPGTSNDGGLPYYCLNKYFSYSKKIVPHTGQKFTFCNTEFEILSTQESHLADKIKLVNDASIILRMHANGVKTIFLADAEAQTTSLLIGMYGNALKSDIMQIAHHGFSGGSVDLYKLIDPDWSLWPTSQECFNQRTNWSGNGNAQSQNNWAKNNTTCYVGDGNIEIISFANGNKAVVANYTPKTS